MFCALLLLAVFSAKAQPTQVIIIRPLQNFFLDDRVKVDDPHYCRVISKRSDFIKTFGIAKTGTNKVELPDFTKDNVIMLALPASEKDVYLTYTNAIKAGDFIEVYCKINKSRAPLTYTQQHVVLGIIPKYTGLHTIRFYDQRRHLLKAVKVN